MEIVNAQGGPDGAGEHRLWGRWKNRQLHDLRKVPGRSGGRGSDVFGEKLHI